MYLLDKVYKSRKILKDLLSNEWSTDVIQDVSLKELELMYNTQNDNAYVNSGCNITLHNLKIPSHKLHIIYYNFPELHRSGTKVNKTCCDKLLSYYKKEGFEDDYLFEKEDSLLVIINEPISETLEKNIENMYSKGQDELLKYGISENLKKEMKSSSYEMNLSYFRNIHLFHLDGLTINLLNHRLVPKHECVRLEEDINTIYELTNSNAQLLPVILRTDPMAKLLRLCPGNICKITRYNEKCGESIYYRICK